MIASHYAEPLDRVVECEAILRSAPSADAETVASISPGEAFLMLDESLGWAWGYAGKDRRVGYIESSALV